MASNLPLAPGDWCANCYSKMVNLQVDLGGFFRCSCSDCQSGKFSRCGRCHLVPYCSKECQLEDWGFHRKLCKNLARRETVSAPSPNVQTIFSDLWCMNPRVSIPLPHPLPNVQTIWIDLYLGNLLNLASSVSDLKPEMLPLLYLFKAYFWFYASCLKDGKVIELQFSMTMLNDVMGHFI